MSFPSDGPTQSIPTDDSGRTLTAGDQTHPGCAPAGGCEAIPAATDRYTFGQEVARGGMGVVYTTRDQVLNREVAVKLLREEFRDRPAVAERFVEEARITARLQHPGIPPIHDLGTLPDGRPFLAMKLIRGRTLADLLQNRPNSDHDLPRYLQVFEHIAQAVGYAHSRNVIHRDLKPANVMVGAFGEVQVMDWGLAKVVTGEPPSGRYQSAHPGTEPVSVLEPGRSGDSATQAGSVLGTPAYMPPEQARGDLDRVGYRADVFALGAILCRILTDEPPYTGSGEEVRALALTAQLGPALGRLAGCGADPELINLCGRCLSPAPEDRPADGKAVADAVAAYRSGVEGRLRKAEIDRARAEERAAEGRKRRRLRRALAGTVGVFVLAGGLVVGWLDHRAEQQRLRQAEEVRAESERRQAHQGIMNTLRLCAELRRQSRFREARAAIDQAHKQASASGADDFHPFIEQVHSDLEFVIELFEVRRKKSLRITDGGWPTDTPKWPPPPQADPQQAPLQFAEPAGTDTFNTSVAPPLYRAAFLARGLDFLSHPDQIVALAAASEVRPEMVDALDDWALDEPNPELAGRLLTVAQRLDPGPWKDRFRNPAVRKDRAGVEGLARDVDPAAVSPVLLATLAELLVRRGGDPGRLFVAAHLAHRTSFDLAFARGQWLLRQNFREAEGSYLAALAIRPDDPIVLNNLGAVLRAKGDLDGAVITYREALRLDPRLATTLNNLGVVLRAKGDVAGAIACYREAIRIDPRDAKSHANLARALAGEGRYREAEEVTQEAVRLNPRDAAAHSELGLILRTAGDLDRAVAAYHKAIELDPAFAPSHANLGIALCIKGDLDGGVVAYREAVRLDPNDATTYTNLGSALAARRDLNGAIAAYREAIRLAPNEARTHANLGNILTNKGDWDGAVAVYQEAVRLDPNDARVRNNLGIALARKGAIDGAIAEFREAIRLNPMNAYAHSNLGTMLRNKGDLDGALAAFREAVRLDPKHAPAQKNLDVLIKLKSEKIAPPPREVNR
jgi:tetratricopeptide (TPR) repeat protein